MTAPETLAIRVDRFRRVWPVVARELWPRPTTLIPALSLLALTRACGLVLPLSIKHVVDDVIGRGQRELLLPIVLAVGGAAVVGALASYANTRMLLASARHAVSDLRSRVYAHVLRLPVAFFDAAKTGDLTSSVMHDVEGIYTLISSRIVEMVGGLATSAIALVVLLRIDWRMTTVLCAIVSIAGAVAIHRLRSTSAVYRGHARAYAQTLQHVTESIWGIRVVKGFNAEARAHGTLNELTNELRELERKSAAAIASSTMESSLAVAALGMAVLYWGTRAVVDGQLTLGSLFTYMAFVGVFVTPLSHLPGFGSDLLFAAAGVERIHQLLERPTEDTDANRVVAVKEVAGHVRFEDVSFAYAAPHRRASDTPSGTTAARLAVKNVSFDAQPGTVTALVGPSGAGKSTIMALVAGFYAPSSGRVSVDGTDLSTIVLSSYRRHLGVVLQDVFVFDGTLRENVAIARPDAPDHAIAAACRTAHLDELIAALPQGLDTTVGERGVQLSGGQRQRLAIARALVADPRILILDEATSSLDSASEALVQQSLASLMAGRTTFIVAHRLGTVQTADQILVLDEGAIVERGNHQALCERRGAYHEMRIQQLGRG